MYHEYPYTTYYSDIDQICQCCSAASLHLDTNGDYLRLIDDSDGSVISAVKVTYADTALEDVEGRPIKTYLIQAGTNGTSLVFTHGDGTLTSFEVPYAQTAATDTQNKDILDYVYGLSISGDKVRITNGDSTVYELTIPFATTAATDVEGKDLTTYAATLTVDGRELVLSDSAGRELSRITVPYAVKAKEDIDGDDIKTTYGTQITTGTTTLNLLAKDGTVLNTITVPYATTAVQDTDGNLFLSDYAEKIVVDADGKRIGVEAHDGTRLATITVPFATLATDATNAVENIQVVGDQIVFTTYGGQTFSITAPYAVKAQKDDLGNTIKNTYFASVDNDTDAGTMSFYDATGTLLATIQNGTITRAIYDNYDNTLADYIKAIQATAGSDYLTATHGDGTVDSIKVDYAERAWKDTNDNVIKNTYVKRLSIAQDPDDGQWKLFAFNGDDPEALLFALTLPGSVVYTAGENITISEDYVISATDTTYTAGENITISEDNVISATNSGVTYTAGENITISDENVISATDTTYVEGFGIDIGSVDSYFTRLSGAYTHSTVDSSSSSGNWRYYKMNGTTSTNTPLADSFSTDTPYAVDLLSMENGSRTFGCTTSNGNEFSITATKTDDRYITFTGTYGENTVSDCISTLDVNDCDIAVLVPIRYTMQSTGAVIYEYGVYMKQTVYAIGTMYLLFGWGISLDGYSDSLPDNAISVESDILSEITNLATSVDSKQDTLTAGENITISDNVISADGLTYTGDGTVVTVSDENVISVNFADAIESSGLPVRSGVIMNEFMSFIEKAIISFSYTDLSIPAGDSYIDLSKSIEFTVPDGYTVISVVPQVNYLNSSSTLTASPLAPLWYYDGATSRWYCGLQNPSDIDPTAVGTVTGSATVYLTLIMAKTAYI